jgi:hypothetical protein
MSILAASWGYQDPYNAPLEQAGQSLSQINETQDLIGPSGGMRPRAPRPLPQNAGQLGPMTPAEIEDLDQPSRMWGFQDFLATTRLFKADNSGQHLVLIPNRELYPSSTADKTGMPNRGGVAFATPPPMSRVMAPAATADETELQ